MAYTNYIDDMELKDPNDPNTYVTYGLHDKDHRADNTVHVTSQDKTNWNNKITDTDYATQEKGGTVKAWLEGTTLYIQTVDE